MVMLYYVVQMVTLHPDTSMQQALLVVMKQDSGTASGNLALSGGTMSGNITFNQDEGGIVFARNTDGASILFYNDSTDTNSRLEFNINDNVMSSSVGLELKVELSESL